jgi:hypothetical protein
MWAELLTLTLMGPIHLQAHESAHALAAHCNGYELVDYKPYPHKMDGHYYFGSVSYIMPIGKEMDTIVAMAPYMWDATLFIATDLLTTYGDFDAKTKRIMRIAGMLVPIINTAFNLIGYYIRDNPINDFRSVGRKERVVTASLLTLASIRFAIVF